MKGLMLLTLLVALLYGVALAGYSRCKYDYDCPKTRGKCYYFKCYHGRCVKKNWYQGHSCYLKGCYEKKECDGYGTCECKSECDEYTNCKSDSCTNRYCDKNGYCQATCNKWCYDDYNNKGYCDNSSDYSSCGVCKVDVKNKKCEATPGCYCTSSCSGSYKALTTMDRGHCYKQGETCCCPPKH